MLLTATAATVSNSPPLPSCRSSWTTSPKLGYPIHMYFSDRELGPRARTNEEMMSPAWGGLCALFRRLAEAGWFGEDFPKLCPDGPAVIGTNWDTLRLAAKAELPEMSWPPSEDSVPDTLVALDFVEFCDRYITKAERSSYHSFFAHHHLRFDRDAGQAEFREHVERIFARNGLAYELGDDGKISRVASPVLDEELMGAVFDSGDEGLDDLLETSRTKFLDPDPSIRDEALEVLWDAWERTKTLEPGDKKASAVTLLEKAADNAEIRDMLTREARELNGIGNKFHIRHAETDQVELESSEQTDYLFHRLFAMIILLLRCSDRME